MSSKNSNNNNCVTVEDYQPIDVEQYNYEYSQVYKEDEAKNEHNNTVREVVDSLNTLYFEQHYGNTIDNDIVDDLSSYSVADDYYYKEDKYKLSNTSVDVQDVDKVLENTVTKYYKISSDETGNIYFVTGDSLYEVNSKPIYSYDSNGRYIYKILGKNQSASDINSVTCSDAYMLEQKTGAISNFIDSLERNTGNDITCSWASSDGKWYNESATIYYMYNKSTIDVGILQPSERALVNGIRVSDSDGDAGVYNQGNRAVAFQWVATADDVSPEINFANTSVKFNMANLLRTKICYSTNMSVTDN